jgi:hypothetical protein
VLPAVEPADAPIGPFMHTQALRIAVAPSSPFSEGWFNLAMAAENPTVGTDKQQRAIHGSQGYLIAFELQ